MTNLIIHQCFRYFYFFIFCCFIFFISPVDNENIRLRLVLTIPTRAPITLANDTIETLPFAADKTIKDLSK